MVSKESETLARRDRLVRLAEAALASDEAEGRAREPAPSKQRPSRVLASAAVVMLLFAAVGLAVALRPGGEDKLTTAGGPSAPFEPVGAGAGAVVEIFSGRPNPTWVLSTDNAAEIRATLEQLPADDLPVSETPGRLGFSGFRISGPDAALPSVSISPGRVVVTAADKTFTSYSDPDNTALKVVAAIAEANIPADEARLLTESLPAD